MRVNNVVNNSIEVWLIDIVCADNDFHNDTNASAALADKSSFQGNTFLNDSNTSVDWMCLTECNIIQHHIKAISINFFSYHSALRQANIVPATAEFNVHRHITGRVNVLQTRQNIVVIRVHLSPSAGIMIFLQEDCRAGQQGSKEHNAEEGMVFHSVPSR